MAKMKSYMVKLIVFMVFAIALVFYAGLYNTVSSRMLINATQELLVSSNQITLIYDKINELQDEMENFLSTRSSEALQKFYDKSIETEVLNKALAQSASYSAKGIKIKNLSEMIAHYLSLTDTTVVERRNNNTEKYIEGYDQCSREYAYIGGYIQQIMSENLSDSAVEYISLQNEINNSVVISNTMLALTVALATLGTFLFAFEISKPLTRLAGYAKDISEGNYDIEIKMDNSSREMHYLYGAFSDMADNINRYVADLHDKQRLEQKLSEVEINSLKMETSLKAAEIKNLKMETSLREAELHALQYQVNPHFIFNTINIGAKLAMLQGDQRTCEYLENTAAVFRYNLKSKDVVELSSEIQNIEAYIQILTTRFGNKLRFNMDVADEGVLKVKMPSLTLQPLVENAFIHGISKSETGGDITLSVTDTGKTINVTISNTGPPIPPAMTAQILAGEDLRGKNSGNNKVGHTNNIGIVNVLKRLRIYYDTEDVMNIICGGGRTNIILKLPVISKIDGDEKDVQNSDSGR